MTGKNDWADAMSADCTLCPRKCHANRGDGQVGICGQTDEVRIARAALHFWEEPCISGENGSGAVFFCGCPLHCVYCQNKGIADYVAGGNIFSPVSADRLAEIFIELQEQGAENINLVTPTQFVPQIVRAVESSRRQGLGLPIVYNTSCYESVETLKMMEGVIDIYLPDLKYLDPALAARYSHASDYSDAAKEAIAEMVRQTGAARFVGEAMCVANDTSVGATSLHQASCARGDASSCRAERARNDDSDDNTRLMRSGTIVRHLVLPSHVAEAKAVISYLYNSYGDDIYISIMNQYTPLLSGSEYPELERRVTRREYDAVVDYAISIGVTNAFVQEGGTAAESFIPAFDGTGV